MSPIAWYEGIPAAQFRPTVPEAATEAALCVKDPQWTSNLTNHGMTRIARSVVLALEVPPVCWCDSDTYEVPCEVH